jgi:hypothetical protein
MPPIPDVAPLRVWEPLGLPTVNQWDDPETASENHDRRSL